MQSPNYVHAVINESFSECWISCQIVSRILQMATDCTVGYFVKALLEPTGRCEFKDTHGGSWDRKIDFYIGVDRRRRRETNCLTLAADNVFCFLRYRSSPSTFRQLINWAVDVFLDRFLLHEFVGVSIFLLVMLVLLEGTRKITFYHWFLFFEQIWCYQEHCWKLWG